MLWKQSAQDSLFRTLSGNSFQSWGQNFFFISLLFDFELSQNAEVSFETPGSSNISFHLNLR